jgi:hypothetical protein
MAFGLADLYHTAELFFGEEETRAYCTPAAFMTDSKRQWLALYCVREFCKSDNFFAVVGQRPMPSYGAPPTSITDFLQYLANLLTAGELDERITNNSLKKLMISWKYTKYWEFPDLFLSAPLSD